MIVKIYPENPNPREIDKVVETLREGGVVVYPTDGVYAFGCALSSVRAIERLKTLRGKKNGQLTIVCESLSRIAEYARVDNSQFKVMKRNLPGPFTFVLDASGRVPDKALGRRKTVGVRIPDNSIPLAIIAALDEPLVTASVKDPDDVVEYTTDPELIAERYGREVDMVIDGGYGLVVPSTIVDLTGDQAEIIRQGARELN